MDKKKKFLFDLNYFDDDNVMHKAEDPNAPPPAPTFSEEELEAAKKAAFDQGVAEGKKQALESIEQEKQNNLQSMQQSLSALFDCEEDRNQRLETHVIALAFKALEKTYPRFMELAGTLQTREMLQTQLQTLRKLPSIDISLAPAMAKRLEGEIHTLKERLAAQGSWTILEDETLNEGACEIAWNNGGLDWRPDKVHAAITEAFAPYLQELEQEFASELDALDQNLHNEQDKPSESPPNEDATAAQPQPSAESETKQETPIPSDISGEETENDG